MPGGPPVDVNKGFPSYDPSGRFLFMQAVMPSHKGQAGTDPGEGYYQDILAWDTRSNRWFNLTHYPANGVHGALIPRLSRDGKRIAWAEVYRAAPTLSALLYYSGFILTGPIWGSWRLSIADVIYDDSGVHLANIKHFDPGHADFYETQDWSSDNRHLLFAASIGNDSPWKLSIWIMDTATQSVRAFTRFGGNFSEHATFTNNGKKIVYMSSKCCQVEFNNPVTLAKTLSTEMYIANVDGTDDAQLTDFNETVAGKRRVVSDKMFFSPFNGNMAILEQQVLPPYGVVGKQTDAPRLLVQVAGDCGA